MKKIIALLLAAVALTVVVLFLAIPTLADSGGAAEDPQFFTWKTLATYAGAFAATMLITQMLKGIGFISKIPTRIFSWFIATIVLIAANHFMGTLNADTVGLCIINAVVVSLAANGGYDAIASAIKAIKSD